MQHCKEWDLLLRIKRCSTLSSTVWSSMVTSHQPAKESQNTLMEFVHPLKSRSTHPTIRSLHQDGMGMQIAGASHVLIHSLLLRLSLQRESKKKKKKVRTGRFLPTTTLLVYRVLYILLMEEILHQLIGTLSHSLQGLVHSRWCRICSINSTKWLDAFQ